MEDKHGIPVTKPGSILNRAVKFKAGDFFKSLTKAVARMKTGSFGQAAGDAVDALSAVGLAQDCGETAWLLIQRSLTQAVYELVKENEALIDRDASNPAVRRRQSGLPPDDPESITSRLDLSLEQGELTVDESFFRRPAALPVLEQFKTPFRQWLEMFGLNASEAGSIANRLPSYFVYALNDQWRTRPEDYICLKEAFNTPFTKAGAAEQAWQRYAAWLQKQVDEPMFVEAFSLRQVYVPLRAYYAERPLAEREGRLGARPGEAKDAKRFVVRLQEELDAWLANPDPKDAIRVVSGGPGSGKSSFAKMFAARVAERNERRVLFVPLHLLELSDELEEAVRKFIRFAEPDLPNPLAPDEQAAPSLVIFDGLDELAMQGKLAAELAQQFVREVREKVNLLNLRGGRTKVLVSGRELAVQTSTVDFKQPRQVLHVLPYFVSENDRRGFTDEHNLLGQDQRQEWWSNYGRAGGQAYEGLPEELGRDELLEITSQPLLNYLVALSFARGEVDLSKESNLNVIYRDLLRAVYERGWAENRNLAVQGVPEDKFIRWLEEIAVAAWHGDGRTTTVEEIKAHTEGSGAMSLLNLFEEGADKGITRLLMAFYFRRAGVRDSGEKTFEFTHKSFGEYLTARRIVRLLRDIREELERHRENVDKGWDEREALARWVRLCGPAALDDYLFGFIEDEVRLCGEAEASQLQETLCQLVGFELRNGLPMELIVRQFKEACRQARNAEESLIALLNACARVTEKLSNIDWPTPEAFGELLSRVVGQSDPADVAFIVRRLSFLNLRDCNLCYRDLIQADLQGADLTGTNLSGSNLNSANLYRAVLTGAILTFASLESVSLNDQDLSVSDLYQVNLSWADLCRTNLGWANLYGAQLNHANLTDADLTNARLTGANLTEANLSGVQFDGATLYGAVLDGALFEDDAQRQAILRLAGDVEEDSEGA